MRIRKWPIAQLALCMLFQLILTDPQQLQSAARLIQQHRHELEYLLDLIQRRLDLRYQEPIEWNADNAFQWRFMLQGDEVPPETGEQVAGLYERKEYEKAKSILNLLIDCFDHYADGYNYLGLIAHDERRLEEAIGYFEKTIEVGRRLFPRRIAKDRYWSDLATRPYMRGLGNLAMALNEVGRYKDALALCDRLANECGDEFTAAAHKADIFLNTLAAFLHAALRYPLAARILVDLVVVKQRERKATVQ